MRHAPRPLAISLLALLCAVGLGARRGPAPQRAAAAGYAVQIRVHPRAGVRYARMEGDSIAVLRLLRCAPAARETRGQGRVGNPGERAVADNGAGDRLEIPAGGGRGGMNLEIRRRPGIPFRSVEVNADGAITRAILSIDLTGCEDPAGATVVHWGGGSNWDDVGGSVAGSTITAELTHLSIYAVAGN
jgi:hypothetical protein